MQYTLVALKAQSISYQGTGVNINKLVQVFAQYDSEHSTCVDRDSSIAFTLTCELAMLFAVKTNSSFKKKAYRTRGLNTK